MDKAISRSALCWLVACGLVLQVLGIHGLVYAQEPRPRMGQEYILLQSFLSPEQTVRRAQVVSREPFSVEAGEPNPIYRTGNYITAVSVNDPLLALLEHKITYSKLIATFSLINVKTSELRITVPAGRGLRNIDISRDGSDLVGIVCDAESCGIQNYSFQHRIWEVLVRDDVSSTSSIDLSPDGSNIVFETKDRNIAIWSREEKSRHIIGLGTSVAWAPDGQILAYLNKDRVYLYNTISRQNTEIYWFWKFWQSTLNRRLIWSPDGRYVILNATAGFEGHTVQCLVIDVENGVLSYTLEAGSAHCVGWVSVDSAPAEKE